MGFYFTINSMSWESKGTPLFTDKALFLLGGKGDGGIGRLGYP